MRKFANETPPPSNSIFQDLNGEDSGEFNKAIILFGPYIYRFRGKIKRETRPT